MYFRFIVELYIDLWLDLCLVWGDLYGTGSMVKDDDRSWYRELDLWSEMVPKCGVGNEKRIKVEWTCRFHFQ